MRQFIGQQWSQDNAIIQSTLKKIPLLLALEQQFDVQYLLGRGKIGILWHRIDQATGIGIGAGLVDGRHATFVGRQLVERKVAQCPFGERLRQVRAEILVDEQGHCAIRIGVRRAVQRVCNRGQSLIQQVVGIDILRTLLLRAKFAILIGILLIIQRKL